MYILQDIHNSEFRQRQEMIEEKEFGNSKHGELWELEVAAIGIAHHHSVNFDRGQGLSIQEVSGSGNLEAS